jgi:hypothetical protein
MKSTRQLIQEHIDNVGYITYGHLPNITQATCAQRVLRTMLEKKPLPYIRIKPRLGAGYKIWFKSKAQFRKMLSKHTRIDEISLSFKSSIGNEFVVLLGSKTYKEAMRLLKE